MQRLAKLLVLFVLTLALPSDSRGESELTKLLDTALDEHSTARRTTVTLKVLDLASGEVLYDRGGDRLLTPASNLKIYTSACALDLFGPEHQFQTNVKCTGPIADGVLNGNLVLVGGGDAMLSHVDLAKIADRVVKELSIKQIHGEVVVDNSRYSSPLKGPGWMWDDDPESYNMSITPLMVDFNVLELQLTPTAKSFEAKLLLRSSYPALKLVRRKALTDKVLAMRHPFTHPILVAKKATLDKKKKLKITMLNPRKWVQGVFTAMLKERGVQFSPTESATANSQDVQQLEHLGPTLAATLKHFNHKSENAVGEVLLHEIAIAKGTSKPKWADGAKAITTWLIETAGLEKDSFRIVDGSGLSRYDLISADSSVHLLKYMQSHEHAETFYDALKPYEIEIDGKKRTLIAAKPGGMGSVSTISGYLTTLDGRKLAFSLLANGYVGSAKPVFGLREDVWRILAQYDGNK